MSEVKRTNRNQPIGTPRICLCSFQALSSTSSFDSILCRSNLQERHMSGDPRAMQMQSPSSVHLTNMLGESLGGFLILCLQVSSWSSPGPLSYLFSDHSLEVGNLPHLATFISLSTESHAEIRRALQLWESGALKRASPFINWRWAFNICLTDFGMVASVPNDCITGLSRLSRLSQATISSFPTSICPQWPVPDNKHPQNKCGWARMNSAPIQDLGGHQILRSLKHTESLPHRFLRLPHMHGKRCLSTKV